MESIVVNSRADLDAIIGTQAHSDFMRMLAGTIYRVERDADAKAFVVVTDTSTIERFGLTIEDFPGTTKPSAPEWIDPPTPDYSALRAAAYRDESDPLFFKEQRGEVPVGTWLAKVNEIKARWPE